MTLACEDRLIAPPLRIRYLRGSGACLVVSFAGVGTERKSEPPAEFFRLAHGAAGENHVLFVSDESRSWMNAPGMAEAVAAAVSATAREIGASRVVAIGNSMGGSAAMILASLMPVDEVLAVTPQFSVNPAIVPEETRWRYFRNKITAWPFPQVPDLAGRGEVTVLHGDSDDELIHARRFAPMAAHFIFAGQDHRLARSLHGRGLLAPIVSNAIAGRTTRARNGVRNAGGVRLSRFARQQRSTEETLP